jgi:hypothetical protein
MKSRGQIAKERLARKRADKQESIDKFKQRLDDIISRAVHCKLGKTEVYIEDVAINDINSLLEEANNQSIPVTKIVDIAILKNIGIEIGLYKIDKLFTELNVFQGLSESALDAARMRMLPQSIGDYSKTVIKIITDISTSNFKEDAAIEQLNMFLVAAKTLGFSVTDINNCSFQLESGITYKSISHYADSLGLKNTVEFIRGKINEETKQPAVEPEFKDVISNAILKKMTEDEAIEKLDGILNGRENSAAFWIEENVCNAYFEKAEVAGLSKIALFLKEHKIRQLFRIEFLSIALANENTENVLIIIEKLEELVQKARDNKINVTEEFKRENIIPPEGLSMLQYAETKLKGGEVVANFIKKIIAADEQKLAAEKEANRELSPEEYNAKFRDFIEKSGFAPALTSPISVKDGEVVNEPQIMFTPWVIPGGETIDKDTMLSLELDHKGNFKHPFGGKNFNESKAYPHVFAVGLVDILKKEFDVERKIPVVPERKSEIKAETHALPDLADEKQEVELEIKKQDNIGLAQFIEDSKYASIFEDPITYEIMLKPMKIPFGFTLNETTICSNKYFPGTEIKHPFIQKDGKSEFVSFPKAECTPDTLAETALEALNVKFEAAKQEAAVKAAQEAEKQKTAQEAAKREAAAKKAANSKQNGAGGKSTPPQKSIPQPQNRGRGIEKKENHVQQAQVGRGRGRGNR